MEALYLDIEVFYFNINMCRELGMNIGILGQGRLGLQLAEKLRSQGHSVTAWSTRVMVDSGNGNRFQEISPDDLTQLQVLIVASGSSSPAKSSPEDELSRTWNLVEDSIGTFFGKIFYLSSGAVYGDTFVPVSEDAPTDATTIYGISKLTAEDVFRASLGNQFCSLRIGNIFPKNPDFGIFKMISDRIKEGNDITFFGGPEDSRDYIDEEELITLLGEIVTLPGLPGSINVGSGKSLPLHFFESEISRHSQGKISCLWHRRNSFDVSSTFLDNSLLKELLSLEIRNPSEKIQEFLKGAILNLGNSK